jgi:hypothetical protein
MFGNPFLYVFIDQKLRVWIPADQLQAEALLLSHRKLFEILTLVLAP